LNPLAKKIREYAITHPGKPAIEGEHIQLDYRQLLNEIEALSSTLGFPASSDTPDMPQTFAVIMDNHPAWAVLDLSLFFSHQCAIPLPEFFSLEQLKHALRDSTADFLILDDTELNQQLAAEIKDTIESQESIIIAAKKFTLFRLRNNANRQAGNGIAKITYTSGTTDHPKGVMLSEDTIMVKVAALAKASEANADDRSLCILPLSTLLENIGGLYIPLYCGATIILLSPETTGLSGSSQVDHEKLIGTILKYKPTAFIIIPQLLLLFIKLIQSGLKLPSSLRFIAMGGAPVSRQLLDRAQQLEIPVYEGYGLSEAASVVAVNNPSQHRSGSVGKVLDSHEVKISDDGEVLVKKALFAGYQGQQPVSSHEFYATGDIGKLDDDGYLYITGRKKNVINTSYGRNISPEWLEKELETMPEIVQGVIYGHAKPYLVAILVLRNNTEAAIIRLGEALQSLNEQLPDYARIKDFIVSEVPFSVSNHLLTGTGRPRRLQIYKAFEAQLEQLYEQQTV